MPIDRRKFLQTSGGLGGGLAAILASRRAPAYAQGTSLHWLRLVDFVPASDLLLRRERSVPSSAFWPEADSRT